MTRPRRARAALSRYCGRQARSCGRLEGITIALAADVAAIGRAEMHRHDQRAALRRTLEYGRARLQRLVGPDAIAVVPIGPHDLDRIVHHARGEQALFAARAQAERQHAWRMARHRLGREAASGFALAVHEVRKTRIEDRQHAVDEGALVDVLLALVIEAFPVIEIVFGDKITRLRK